MTAVIDADHKTIDCPHCKGKLNVEIERKPANVRIEDHDHDDSVKQKLAELDSFVKEKFKEPEKPKKSDPVLPSFVPGYNCVNCGGEVHTNKGYKRKAAYKCGKCGNYSATDKGDCAWCGEKDWEELDEEEQSWLPEPKHAHEDDQ